MARTFAYPPDLAEYVFENWSSPFPLDVESFAEVLAICFQASFMREEERPIRFRLLLGDPTELPEDGYPNIGALRLRFTEDRALSPDELRRLSPSTPFESALIGAHICEGRPRIWGVAHSGPAWLAPTWGGRSTVKIWTVSPIIHVSGAGRLAVRRAGQLIGALERGVIADTTMDVFESSWLSTLFVDVREGLREEHAQQHGASHTINAQVDHSLLRTVSQHMLRRAIRGIRAEGHGGMILFADAGEESVRLKYRFAAEEPRRRYRTLLQRLMTILAENSTTGSVGWEDYATSREREVEQIERHIFEMSRLIASLAGIDGAVLMTKRFEIVGFGAEVSANIPAPRDVLRALDIEGAQREPDRAENVGTRHRAAYRFIRENPTGLAIVISHDGAVRFVAAPDGDVTFWEQTVGP